MGKLRKFLFEDVKKMYDFFHALGAVLQKLLKKQRKRNEKLGLLEENFYPLS